MSYSNIEIDWNFEDGIQKDTFGPYATDSQVFSTLKANVMQFNSTIDQAGSLDVHAITKYMISPSGARLVKSQAIAAVTIVTYADSEINLNDSFTEVISNGGESNSDA